MTAIPLGKSETRRQGRRFALLAFGTMVAPAMTVGEKLDATVVNMRFVKPLDHATILEVAHAHDILVTLDENAIAGGAGAAVSEFLLAEGIHLPTLHIGLLDVFLDQGTREELLADAGLDAESILKKIKNFEALLTQSSKGD